jgi:WD40 repeat protein
VTSVQFHPSNATTVLTNGMDSCVKIVDIRTSAIVQTFKDPNFQTSYAWSSASFSPDGKFQNYVVLFSWSWRASSHFHFLILTGKYVASGSSSNGNIFVWDVAGGKLTTRLQGHQAGVCGFSWGRGGSSGQQVASVDKNGMLILWI